MAVAQGVWAKGDSGVEGVASEAGNVSSGVEDVHLYVSRTVARSRRRGVNWWFSEVPATNFSTPFSIELRSSSSGRARFITGWGLGARGGEQICFYLYVFILFYSFIYNVARPLPQRARELRGFKRDRKLAI